jgi:pimeloyl-ACP methyl ester carboxylesterase
MHSDAMNEQAQVPEPFMLDQGPVRLAVYRWGEPSARRPAALLVHGTGFCGPVWQGVARDLAADFVVYAIDRRGHGASGKPTNAYHFADFAEDVIGVIDALQLDTAYGIGHSAGATDLLLASIQRPDAFRCILAMEPTVMHPTAPWRNEDLQAIRDQRLDIAGRRRASFASFDEVFEHYRARDAFRAWRPELLRAYVRYGFEEREDGTVSLRCHPTLERAMLTHIFRAMDGSYEGDYRGNPFAMLDRAPCPICVTTTEGSQSVFKEMAEMARTCIPRAAALHFADVGHNVAQAQPEAVSMAARRFWKQASEQ